MLFIGCFFTKDRSRKVHWNHQTPKLIRPPFIDAHVSATELDIENTQPLDRQRDLLLRMCRTAGQLHYQEQSREYGLSPRKQCLYDVHCITTASLSIYRQAVSTMPLSKVDSNSVDKFEEDILLVSCFLLSMQSDEDDCVVPTCQMLKELGCLLNDNHAESELVSTIVSMQLHIMTEVNVFDIVQNNQHRVVVERIVRLQNAGLLDSRSTGIAFCTGFFLVLNLYAEVECYRRFYGRETLGNAIAIAALFCIHKSVEITGSSYPCFGTQIELCLAKCFLRRMVYKSSHLRETASWTNVNSHDSLIYRATRPCNIRKAIEVIDQCFS